jgi:uncharacterized protein YbaP (TraB family)
MTILSQKLSLPLAALALIGLQGCASTRPSDTDIITQAAQAAGPIAEPVTEVAEASGPALWKVADEDTTIYLFGTVHALPDDIDWFNGPIAEALTASDTLVTEIDAASATSPANQQFVMGKAINTEGTPLREVLSEEQLASYDAALTSLELPAAAFDQFKPWFAGMTLGVVPLLKNGFTAQNGVEMVLNDKVGAEIERDALETVEYQIGVFDNLPLDSQIAFLVGTAETVDEIVPMVNAMIAEWSEGDADGLAEIMNSSLTDPVLAEALLYQRNRNWAEWIETRLDEPGTVFIAVGAGHLAGKKSVQDYVVERGLTVERVQ